MRTITGRWAWLTEVKIFVTIYTRAGDGTDLFPPLMRKHYEHLWTAK